MKKIISLILLSALFLLCACGKQTPPPVNTVTADGLAPGEGIATILPRAREVLSSVSNLHMTSVSSLNIKNGESEIISSTSYDGDLDITAGVMHATVSIDDATQTTSYETYYDGGNYYMGNGDSWVKMAKDDKAPGIGFADDMNMYLDGIAGSGKASVSVEVLDGKEYFVLSSPVKITTMEMAEKYGISSFIGAVSASMGDESLNDKLLAQLGEIYLVVYLHRDTYLPYGVVVDFQSALTSLYTNLEISNLSVTEANASTLYSDINQLGAITIPENVKNAKQLS